MRARGNELGHGVREGAVWRDVKDGEGVLAVVEAARRQDDGDEVDARVIEERRRARLGQKLSDRS